MPFFPLFTDACVRRQIVDGLQRRGWDVERAVDAFPEGTLDEVLFEHAAKVNRVFVTNDEKIRAIGEQWFSEGRAFQGLDSLATTSLPPYDRRRHHKGDRGSG